MFKMDHHFKDFDRFFVGYDRIAGKLAEIADQSVKLAQNYPPFNIKKVAENRYVIEMALAGFGKQDIDVELADSKLIIRGKIDSVEDSEESVFPFYVYKGVSSKPFTRQFTLADNVEIQAADLYNGMLKIWLEAITPESRKPTKIEINQKEYDDEY